MFSCREVAADGRYPGRGGDGDSNPIRLGTLLSSQPTGASFVLTPAGFPPGAVELSCSLGPLSDPSERDMYYVFLIFQREVRPVKPFGCLSSASPSRSMYLQTGVGADDDRLRGCTAQVLLGYREVRPSRPNKSEVGRGERATARRDCGLGPDAR